MENRRIVLYVLSGAWSTQDYDGSSVLAVSEEKEPLEEMLKQIASNYASEYVNIPLCTAQQECGERHYEISGCEGRWAKFYITEHYVEISESLMGAISREMDKIDRTHDVENYLKELWECGNIEDWKYEYMSNRDDVISGIVSRFEKCEDCNISFNSTMDFVVEEAKKKILLSDEVLEFLWERFGSIPVNDDGEIEEDFMGYEQGTDREEIWAWFDENYSEGVAALMGGINR